MAKYTLYTDFQALTAGQVTKWMCEFCDIAKDAFADQDNRTCLFAHLLLLEAYTNTVQTGLQKRNRPFLPLLHKEWSC